MIRWTAHPIAGATAQHKGICAHAWQGPEVPVKPKAAYRYHLWLETPHQKPGCAPIGVTVAYEDGLAESDKARTQAHAALLERGATACLTHQPKETEQ
jgi:hypothetical protein